VGFGMEILFVLMLGLLVLGPKRLHTILAHAARAKAELENATRGLTSQLAAELDTPLFGSTPATGNQTTIVLDLKFLHPVPEPSVGMLLERAEGR
jgi:Sec-independent protein translocase protein TatA